MTMRKMLDFLKKIWNRNENDFFFMNFMNFLLMRSCMQLFFFHKWRKFSEETFLM